MLYNSRMRCHRPRTLNTLSCRIETGSYVISVVGLADTESCEWGRIVGQEVVETSGYTLDPITVQASNDVLFTFDCGTWSLASNP